MLIACRTQPPMNSVQIGQPLFKGASISGAEKYAKIF
jgi:hypothetical protein